MIQKHFVPPVKPNDEKINREDLIEAIWGSIQIYLDRIRRKNEGQKVSNI
jgi:hypothetical protein